MGVGGLLPWLTARVDDGTTITRNAFQLGNNYGFSPDGGILILLGVITAVIGITRLTSSAMPKWLQRSPIGTGVGAVVVGLNRAPSIRDIANQVNNSSLLVHASIGYGLWVTIVAGIIAVGAGIVLRSRTKPVPPRLPWP
jgi:hypothetical protein